MAYRELAPPPALASHVACLWWRTGAARPVLPDGCVDVVWTGERLIVAGPATAATTPPVPANEVKLGIRFRVGAAASALGCPAHELRDRAPAARELRRDADELEERLAEQDRAGERLATLAAGVGGWVAAARSRDRCVEAAAHALNGGSRVAEACSRAGISERQLRRRFEEAVGYSPKTLARVLRLQRFLRLARGGEPLALLASRAGYSDQPHLTRECVQLAGLPPAALVRHGAAAAGDPFMRA